MDRNYINKPGRKSRQRAKILVARDDFQSDIQSIRKKYGIPEKGFSNEKENRDWHDSFYGSDDEYFDRTWRENRSVLQKLEKYKKKFYEVRDKLFDYALKNNSWNEKTKYLST